jgi:limonene-1,2-epoxide hydrolase
MISPSFKIREFLKALENMDYDQIIKTAQRECRQAEDMSYRVKGAVKARQMGSTDYALELKKFIHFIAVEVHQEALPRKESSLYLPVCESLVRRKQLKPIVLEIFK